MELRLTTPVVGQSSITAGDTTVKTIPPLHVVEKAKRILSTLGPIGRCQIDLINKGFSDEIVLTETRRKFPGHATSKTVSWHRHKVNVLRRHNGDDILSSSGHGT
jgi:hypothetical protein